jgi:hypothetical protein
VTARDVLDGIKARLRPALEHAPYVVKGRCIVVQANNHPELRPFMLANDVAPGLAKFVAAAPTDVALLAGALEAVLAYGADREKYTDTGNPAVDRAIRSYAYHIERVITEALEESQ